MNRRLLSSIDKDGMGTRDEIDQIPGCTDLARAQNRNRVLLAGLLLALALGGLVVSLGGPESVKRDDMRGSATWALEHYGNPDAPGFEKENIVEIDFLGRTMFVHEDAKRHFLRLERLFEARAPEYAAAAAGGELDDWSYENRPVREGTVKSNHAFGIAIDINALDNPLGSAGNMPAEVVRQWEIEGGGWGGNWSRPDPMHFETHLTPQEIRERYRRDGSPRAWYLDELVDG
jgi:D-alanyl-D-alanine carboxypeptidase-like protein